MSRSSKKESSGDNHDNDDIITASIYRYYEKIDDIDYCAYNIIEILPTPTYEYYTSLQSRPVSMLFTNHMYTDCK